MYGLITDRAESNLLRLTELSAKGFSQMTASEQKEWLGNPLEAEGVNLLPCGSYISSDVDLEFYNDAIIATATKAGKYLYATVIIGKTSNFEGKRLTLSAEYVGGQIGMCWYDETGLSNTGGVLSSGAETTFTVNESTNPANRAYLAMLFYVTTNVEVPAGTKVRFSKVMLENGGTRHDYVPYTEILSTPATKGAYNYSDLNRVERATAELSNMLGLGLITKTDWQMWDVPKQSDMERYLNNIKKIQNALNIEIGIPNTMSNLDFGFANNIETVLLTAFNKLAVTPRSGELFLGEI